MTFFYNLPSKKKGYYRIKMLTSQQIKVPESSSR